MNDVEQLIEAFGARGKRDHASWKLDVLMDLAGHDDPKVVSFFQAVLTDDAEPGDVRIDALKRLREAPLAPHERVRVAEASLGVLSRHSESGLRLQAALVLGITPRSRASSMRWAHWRWTRTSRSSCATTRSHPCRGPVRRLSASHS